MSDEQRIAVLEQHVRSLYEQIAALRKELSARGQPEAAAPRAPEPVRETVRPAASPEPPPPPPPSQPPPRRDYLASPPPSPQSRARQPQPDIDLEKLFGRYGTIAVASLAILMGVGTFLSWAIEHGLLGPTVRVVLGFVGAGIVAGVGVWVRDKRDVRFGNVLLALSLAIVHLDAWAAGPRLHVLSTVAALAIAAVASVALAALALTSDERTLFAIGVGGALIAPFVTASEPGSVIALMTYGWIVIATTIVAIRERGWQPLLWLTVGAAAVYVGAGASTAATTGGSWVTIHAPSLFAFACAAAALLWARDALRSKLALSFLALACVAAASYAYGAHSVEVAISVAGTIAAYAIARELETDAVWLAIGNVLLPLGFLAATLISAENDWTRALAALALTVLAALLAWDPEGEREQHLFVTLVASWLAIVLYLAEFDARCVGALALHAALFAIVLRTAGFRRLAFPIALSLVITSVESLVLLASRTPYAYTPFISIPSLCALATVGAWTVLAFAIRPTPEHNTPEDKTIATFLGACAIIAAFGWVRQELVEAFSRDIASFALIVYYALAGLALIFAGRSRRVPLWRGAGLALAYYAGYKALVETFAIDAVALRITARILVGVFLAAVAYWYRAPREPAVVEAPPHEPAATVS
jgi:uncharacterized membrane protein